MNHATDDMTLTEILDDPMIRMVMRADGVTLTDFKTLMYSTANALARTDTGAVSARTHTTNLLAAPKRRLLAMMHPLAVRSSGPCCAYM